MDHEDVLEQASEQAPIGPSMGGKSGSCPVMSDGCLGQNSAIPNCRGCGDSKWDSTVLRNVLGEMGRGRRLRRNRGLDASCLSTHLQPSGKAQACETGQRLGSYMERWELPEPDLEVHGFPELRSAPFASVNLSALLHFLPASSSVRLKGGAKQLPTARGSAPEATESGSLTHQVPFGYRMLSGAFLLSSLFTLHSHPVLLACSIWEPRTWLDYLLH